MSELDAKIKALSGRVDWRASDMARAAGCTVQAAAASMRRLVAAKEAEQIAREATARAEWEAEAEAKAARYRKIEARLCASYALEGMWK